jgi:hypothetical protein
MRMKKPLHPGRVVRQECIEPLGLTVTEAAKASRSDAASLEQSGKRQGWHLGRDGSAAFQSVRIKPGSGAGTAVSILRPDLHRSMMQVRFFEKRFSRIIRPSLICACRRP